MSLNKKNWLSYLAFAVLVIIINQFITNFNGLVKVIKMIQQLFSPFIIAFVIAYLLYPLAALVQRKVFERFKNNKIKHLDYYLGILVAYLIIFLIIAILLVWLIPMITDALSTLNQDSINHYLKVAENYWLDIQHRFGFLKEIEFVDIMNSITKQILNLLSAEHIQSYLKGLLNFTSTLYTWVMGIIISIYMLVEKDRLFASLRKLTSLFVKDDQLDVILTYLNKINQVFIKFFFGKMLDSLIIGILAMIGFYFLNVPLSLVMALVIMVTNMIPYFGPFIGGVPVVILTLIISGNVMLVVWTALFIFLLQQFDGLYLGPKILGDSVGVSAFWVIASITLGGAMFGFAGLLLCVPFTATLRIMFNDYYEYRKVNKELHE